MAFLLIHETNIQDDDDCYADVVLQHASDRIFWLHFLSLNIPILYLKIWMHHELVHSAIIALLMHIHPSTSISQLIYCNSLELHVYALIIHLFFLDQS